MRRSLTPIKKKMIASKVSGSASDWSQMPEKEFRAKIMGMLTNTKITQETQMELLLSENKTLSNKLDACQAAMQLDSARIDRLEKSKQKIQVQIQELQNRVDKAEKNPSIDWSPIHQALDDLWKEANSTKGAVNILVTESENLTHELAQVKNQSLSNVTHTQLSEAAKSLRDTINFRLNETWTTVQSIADSLAVVTGKTSDRQDQMYAMGQVNNGVDTSFNLDTQGGRGRSKFRPEFRSARSNVPSRGGFNSCSRAGMGRDMPNAGLQDWSSAEGNRNAYPHNSQFQQFHSSPIASSQTNPAGMNHDHSMIDISKDLPKLDKFGGSTSEDWIDFIAQYENYAAIKGWGENVSFLSMFLKGRASEFFHRQPKAVQSNYHQCKEVMNKRFGAKVPVEALQALFKALRQKPEEDILDFADNVRKIAHQAFAELKDADDYIEKEMIKAFLKGLRQKDLSIFGFGQKYRNLDECVEGIQVFAENKRSVTELRNVNFAIPNPEDELEEDSPHVRRQIPSSSNVQGAQTNLSPDMVTSLTKAMHQMTEAVKEIKNPMFNQAQLTETIKSSLEQLLQLEGSTSRQIRPWGGEVHHVLPRVKETKIVMDVANRDISHVTAQSRRI